MTASTRHHFTESIYLSKQVPIPAFVLFNERINSAALRHYARIRILAYSHAFQHTELLTANFLADYLAIDTSHLSRVLTSLVQAEALQVTRPNKGELVIHFTDVPAGDVYLLPNHKLTNKPDLVAELTAQAQAHHKGKMSTEQMYAYAALVKRGVYAAPALNLVTEFDVINILEYCEIFDWAFLVKLAKTAGWLRRCISEQWEAPADYVVPADRCSACGGPLSLGIHHKTCTHTWQPANTRNYIFGEDCPTCAAHLQAGQQHADDCWRERFDWQLGMQVMGLTKYRPQPELEFTEKQLNIVNGWREVD